MVRSVLTGGDVRKALELETDGDGIGIIVRAMKMGFLIGKIVSRDAYIKAETIFWKPADRL